MYREVAADDRGSADNFWVSTVIPWRGLPAGHMRREFPAITIRYDTIEEINVDSKAEYTA